MNISDITTVDVEVYDLISALEAEGYTVLAEPEEDSRRVPNQNLHETLCDQFELSRFSTKQELIQHINSLL